MPEPQHTIDANARSLFPARRGRVFQQDATKAAPIHYAGVFRPGAPAPDPTNTPSWDVFVALFDAMAAKGYTLASVDTLDRDRITWYVGAWQPRAGNAPELWAYDNWTEFERKMAELASGGFELQSLDVHNWRNKRFHTGVWISGTTKQELVRDMNWDEFVAERDRRDPLGWRLTNLQAYRKAGTDWFAGVFAQGGGRHALRVEQDWGKFYTFYQSARRTMRLVDFQVYDSRSIRRYIGVWRAPKQPQEQIILGLDWGSFLNRWAALKQKGFLLTRLIAYPSGATLPNPEWKTAIEGALGSRAMGYAYVVTHHGNVVAANAAGLTRSPADPRQSSWTTKSRLNLASVSKPLTAVAVLKLLRDSGGKVDDPFYCYVRKKFPVVGSGVADVRIRHLLTMRSGLDPDPTLYLPQNNTIDDFLQEYLKRPLVGTPGETYAYSNTNFTILQALIEQLAAPDDYATYVTENVLKPMQIRTPVFNTVPDPRARAALSYNDPTEPRPGKFWDPIPAQGAAGWIASADELRKFLVGLRRGTVLPSETVFAMLNDELGWYTYDGSFGPYFHHNGALLDGFDSDSQGLNTGIVRFPDGYDALLLINSWAPRDSVGFDVIKILVRAFEARPAGAALWPLARIDGTLQERQT
jgi:CubicO group peptidase (beta-lactamase class C family)